MKTNKLMTAVALSAMFAACTQDAELNETLAKNDFSNIPMVEADFTVNTGVDSRMTTAFNWQKGDIVGFVWGGLREDGQLDGQAWANYPLYCLEDNEAKFDGQSMYYEGDYYAYIPYDTSLKNVGFVPFSIENQTLSTSMADYAKYTISISPAMVKLSAKEDAVKEGKALEAGTKKNYPLTLDKLSNLAKIDLSFKNASGLADLKVTEVTLDLGGQDYLPVKFNFSSSAYSNFDSDPIEHWSELDPDKFYGSFAKGWADNGEGKTAGLGKLVLKNSDGLAVTDNALTTYAVVLPTAPEVVENNLNVTVKTNYGTVKVAGAKVIAKGEGADKAAGVTSSTALFTTFGATGTIVAEVDMKNAIEIDRVAADQNELNAIIATWIAMGKADYQLKVKLNPAAANDDKTFELTDFETPEGLNKALVLTVGSNAETIVFNGTTTINKNITVKAPSLVNGTMTVDEDVVWQGAGENVTLTINNDAKLINNGTLGTYVKTVAATDTMAAGKYVHNGKKAAVTVNIGNQGEAQWVLGASTAPGTSGNYVYAEAMSIEDLKTINKSGTNVVLVHLVDGAVIANHEETCALDNLRMIECYGNVEFKITDSYSGIWQSITFGEEKTLTAKQNSRVTITSDNRKNLLNLASVIVEEGASLDVNNVELPAEITNHGSVVLKDVKNYRKNEQTQGGYWEESTTHAE